MNGLLLLYVRENELCREHMKHQPIKFKTIKRYMSRLTKIVETIITEILPNTFSIVFDGWVMRDSHFISVYAVFPENNVNGFKRVLLAFSPLKDETKQDANKHYEFLKFVLCTFSQSLSNVAALIGDNCSTNLSLAAMCKFFS